MLVCSSLASWADTFDVSFAASGWPKVSTYKSTNTSTADFGGTTWTIYDMANNQGAWDYMRVGSRQSTGPAYVQSVNPISNAVTGIEVNITVKNNGTLNAIKLLVADNANFTNATVYECANPSNAVGKYTVDVTNPVAGAYYKVAFDYNNTTKNNGVFSMDKITFTTIDLAEDAVNAPVIKGEVVNGKYTVTMTCATEGAEIHYTTDGTEPTAASTLYTAPLEPQDDCTIKAIAVKGEKLSAVTTFNAVLPWIATSLGDLYKAPSYPQTFDLPTAQLTVAYASADGKYVYLYDGTDYMLAFNIAGTTIKTAEAYTGISGTVKKYRNLIELDPYTLGTANGTTAIPTPDETTIEAITTAGMNRYVKLTGVNISSVSGNNGTLKDAAGKTIALYNRFALENFDDANGVTVTGFVSVFDETLQLQPVDITTAGGEEFVAVPEFDPASGAIVPLNTYIHITAEEGATIKYRYGFPETIEDEEFADYADDEVLLNSVGKTYIVEAYAVKGEAQSEVASATYTVDKGSRNLQWVNTEGEPVEKVVYVLNGTEAEKQLPLPDGIFDEAEEFSFTSSNPAVATVNDCGEITVVAAGTTTITLTLPETASYKGQEASFELEVVNDAVVEAPTFDPASGATVERYSVINILAAEGATIYYRFGNETTIADMEFEEYSAGDLMAMTLGTFIVEAYAKVGDDVSETVTATYTVPKPTPQLTWLMDGEPVDEVLYLLNGTEDEQRLPELYFEHDGEDMTFTSSNPDVATVNDWGEVKIESVGTTTITVKFAGNANFEADEASFVLNVYDKNAAGQIVATFDFSKAADITFTPAVEITTGTNIEGSVLTVEGIEISFESKNSNGVKLWTASGQATGIELRFYKDNEMTFKAPASYEFSKIVFTPSYANGTNFNIDLVDNQAGTYDATTYTWEPSAVAARSNDGKIRELTFKAVAASRITKIDVQLTNYITGVSDIAIDTDAEAVYYNIQGVQVQNPSAGLYIRVQGNTATKVIIR